MKKCLDLLNGFLYFLVITMAFTACEEEDPILNEKPVPGAHGVFILNEGGWGKNNAGLSYHNFETNQTGVDILNGQLGDVAQDMISYGSKLYIAVNGSKYIKVIDLYSQISLDSIPLLEDGKRLEPRYLASHDGMIYVTTSDPVKGNVVQIDTVSLTVKKMTKVGSYPEGIAVLNGKLYVANSGYGKGNTLSIIDIHTFQENGSIQVGLNPYYVGADPYNNNIYLSYQGNYGDDLGGIQQVNSQGVVTKLPVSANKKFTIVGDLLYYYGVTYNPDGSADCTLGVYNTKTKTDAPLISDGTKMNAAYGIGVNLRTKDIYIADADGDNPGCVYIFGPDGKKKNRINVGVFPNSFVFY
jgi:YVTN family beta-propeller protein